MTSSAARIVPTNWAERFDFIRCYSLRVFPVLLRLLREGYLSLFSPCCILLLCAICLGFIVFLREWNKPHSPGCLFTRFKLVLLLWHSALHFSVSLNCNNPTRIYNYYQCHDTSAVVRQKFLTMTH